MAWDCERGVAYIHWFDPILNTADARTHLCGMHPPGHNIHYTMNPLDITLLSDTLMQGIHYTVYVQFPCRHSFSMCTLYSRYNPSHSIHYMDPLDHQMQFLETATV